MVRYLTAEQVKRICVRLRCDDGEEYVAGWYFQSSKEDAPIGPFRTKRQAENQKEFCDWVKG